MTTMVLQEEPRLSVEAFLAQEREKDLLRFSTAGSVDDGKSTLIGRLLYDTQSVYDDQLRSIEGKGTTAPGQLDFALLTDGLRAEREQGITIDVAYRYFSTPRRKFIIADTPGHEQYTRNMATGASTADAAVVLIDARKGVLLQSRRHAYIASLLGVRSLVVAVNKMDLVDYSEGVFAAIEDDFRAVLARIAEATGSRASVFFVPVSALAGDNVVDRSAAMPWYEGETLLGVLETIPTGPEVAYTAFRFPVQRVLRPDQNFRGFAGQITSGSVQVGEKLKVLPSGRTAEVERIVTFDGDLEEASAPLSVTLVLSEELDISRGDLLVAAESSAAMSHEYQAAMVWMSEQPLETSRRYLLKHTSQTVPATVEKVEHRTDLRRLVPEPATTLEMNGIGEVRVRLLRPIAMDRYAEHRTTGAFILIDAETNGTVAAGMVMQRRGEGTEAFIKLTGEAVSPEERAARWGHRGGVLELAGPSAVLGQIERMLFESGRITARTASFGEAAALAEAGLIALLVEQKEGTAWYARVNGRERGGSRVIDTNDEGHLRFEINGLLAEAGVLPTTEKRRP